MAIAHGFNGKFPADWRGVQLKYNIMPYAGCTEFYYFNVSKRFSDLEILQDPNRVLGWAENVFLQMKGLQNGLSGQSAQAVPNHPSQSQLGNRYNQLGQFNQAAQQQYSQLAANVTANNSILQQLHVNGKNLAGQTSAGDSIPLIALKTEGIKLGEIIAWRGWKITAQGFLRSMSADVIWAPHEPMEGKIKSTEEHNGCYAYKTASTFLKNHENTGLDVYGRVALWGDIIEHELGYRAQFAKIVGLEGALTDAADGKMSVLRERYLA